MQRHVLVVGLPAAGKTHLSKFFREKGKDAYDADDVIASYTDEKGNPKSPTKEEWEKNMGIKWAWDAKKLKELLGEHEELYLFGASDNMYDFIGLFDKAYYLKADKDLLSERLEARKTSNDEFGKTKEQRKLVFSWIEYSERRAKSTDLRSSMPLCHRRRSLR